MIAWISPGFRTRSIPLRIGLSPTLAWRVSIFSTCSSHFNNHPHCPPMSDSFEQLVTEVYEVTVLSICPRGVGGFTRQFVLTIRCYDRTAITKDQIRDNWRSLSRSLKAGGRVFNAGVIRRRNFVDGWISR